MRSNPSYVNGRLYTVAGERRHVVAIDPSAGETIWSFREPDTWPWEFSTRAAYGKGVAFAEVDGREVVFIILSACFPWALDAETGSPLEGWGREVDVPGEQLAGHPALPHFAPPYTLQGRREDRLIDYTSELREMIREGHRPVRSSLQPVDPPG